MSFATLQSLIDAALPLVYPDVTVNRFTLGPDRFSVDLTDEPGTLFEDRYEIFITGDFGFDVLALDLGAIDGGGLLQLDSAGDPVPGTEVSFSFRKGGLFDGGTYDLTDLDNLLNTPLFGDDADILASLTAGLSARASSLDDWLTGTAFADVFRMFGGDDVVEAGGGNDRIFLGAGNDLAYADGGRDMVYGGTGDDLIFAGGGADHVEGGRGRDAILLGGGDDVGYGDAGADLILGQGGNDTLFGGGGRDLLIGGGGANTLWGGDGDDGLIAGGGGLDKDYLNGGAGRDVLVAGVGLTDMTGGADADVFVFGQSGDEGSFVTVQDFEDGVDRIALTRGQMKAVVAALDDPDSPVITEYGVIVTRGSETGHEGTGFEYLRIQIGKDQMTLAGVADHDIDRSDFILIGHRHVETALDDSGWIIEDDPFFWF